MDKRSEHPAFEEAASLLRDWRRRADFLPPYEFLAGLLDRDGMRARLLARLGAEAADSIDELLNLAISFDDGAPPSLTGFLTWLRESNREIKRDMEHGHNEVRIMTVHGAKGLEAPIVFLPRHMHDAGRWCARQPMSYCDDVLSTGRTGRLRLADQGIKHAACNRSRPRRGRRPRERGAQPAALCRHDACTRPALCRRLRGPRRRGLPIAGTIWF